MREWIIKASTKVYDHIQSFKDNGYIDWSQKVEYQVGDIVYICFVGDITGLKIKTKVTKINIPKEDAFNDYTYWKDKKKYYKGRNGTFARLQLVEILEDVITIRDLIANDMPYKIPFVQRVNTASLSDYIHHRFESEQNIIVTNPRTIPVEIQRLVYKRDNGTCVICGSNHKIHFDHIIPFSKGGTSTNPNNIQVLCEKCNLQKSDTI